MASVTNVSGRAWAYPVRDWPGEWSVEIETAAGHVNWRTVRYSSAIMRYELDCGSEAFPTFSTLTDALRYVLGAAQ